MGLLAPDIKGGQELANAAEVDISVDVRQVVAGRVVGIDAGDIVKPLFFLQPFELLQAGEDTVGIVLLVALGVGNEVTVQPRNI